MIKRALAGAALATAAGMAVAGPAAAVTGHAPESGAATSAHDAIMQLRAPGDTVSGSGSADFATDHGDVAIAGDPGGIANTYGGSLVNADLRCLVPQPEGEGIGGHLLGGPKATCTVAPVDQYQAPQRLL
ncbi:hypothetical protein [Streptomyces sp. NPDC127108]|uniref:hypothetical protein n=1 Tax=Streptomyces sp. NPDC127108 TaxID=3345361 RepID=UPI00363C6008